MAKATTTRTTATKAAPRATTKTTPIKPATIAAKASTLAKPTVASTGPIPVVVTETTPIVTDPALKKKELIDTVTERSGIKKKDAKPVIEAMLAILGETLAEGREMNLPTLGKVKINRAKEVQGGRVLIVKIRQSTRVPKSSSDPVETSAT